MISASSPAVCIVGAGPYGVSIAAHLRSLGIHFRIFGLSMNRWRNQMPAGMFLKSEGCASNLYDDAGHHTLARYCVRERLPFAESGMPVSRKDFVRYAMSFQQELVPNLEESMVVSVDKRRDGFELVLNSGEKLMTGHVVIATGLEHMAFTPADLSRLPANFRSHSADHHDLSRFRGSDVAVIGGGQSALETAALLAEGGASVHLLVRKDSLAWNAMPEHCARSLYQRLRYPRNDLGDGLRHWFYCNTPSLFRYLPPRVRMDKARNVLGPAGAWWLKERVLWRMPIWYGVTVRAAEVRDDRVLLLLSDDEGHSQVLTTDHVIAATGYRFDLRRLPFLSEGIKASLRHEQQQPVLSANYESSVSGLYFTGLASSYSFGPVMRFLCGARHPARCISSRIATRLSAVTPNPGAAFGRTKSGEYEVYR